MTEGPRLLSESPRLPCRPSTPVDTRRAGGAEGTRNMQRGRERGEGDRGRRFQSPETGSHENTAISTRPGAATIPRNRAQGPSRTASINERRAPSPAQALAQLELRGLATLTTGGEQGRGPGGGGLTQTSGPAASCWEPGSVVTEPRAHIALGHRLGCGLEQVPSPC